MNEQRLGYTLHPPRRESSPGYSQVDIYIHPQPTTLHYDPQRLEIPVCQGDKGVQTVTVRYPWNAEEQYDICPGIAHMEDYTGKIVEIFSFGGEMKIDSGEQGVGILLSSNAPILVNYQNETAVGRLAEEVEIVLAERRASFQEDVDLYSQRLSEQDPLLLYFACLKTILARVKGLPDYEGESQANLLHMLKEEIKAIEEQNAHDSRFGSINRIEDLI